MRTYRTMFLISAATLAATVAAGLTGAPALAGDEPTAASAVLTVEAPGGAAVAVGDVLTASVAAGTTADFATAAGGSTGIRCTESAFTATVTDNPEAPGVASESVTAHTFASCTANILGVTRVNGVTVNNTPFATTVDGATGAVTVSGTDEAPIQTTLSLGTILGSVTCVYRAVGNAITGVSANADNSITFTDQAFTKSSGPVTCPGSGFFTARYAPVLDSTVTGTPAVFTN
jgi:hypothetical protein